MKTKIFFSYLLLCSLLIIARQSFSQQFVSIKADTLALTHATIVDGTGQTGKNDQTLIIIKGRIAQIGKSGNVNVPASAKVLDCTGKTIIPGMIMMHEHMFYGENVPPYYLGIEMPFSFPRLYLAGGATTIRTAGTTEAQTDLNIKNWIDEGKMIGPNIDVTGPYIEELFFLFLKFHLLKAQKKRKRMSVTGSRKDAHHLKYTIILQRKI
jgi:imidazolonepropionase-like amidohydrolase